MKLLCFLCNPANVGNLIFSFSSFSKPSLDIWKFLVRITLKPSMQDFKHDLTNKGEECNFLMVSTLFSSTLLGDWDKARPFPVLWPLLGLPDLLTYWLQNPFMDHCLVVVKGLVWFNEAMSHAVQGHRRALTKHDPLEEGKQTTPVYLP